MVTDLVEFNGVNVVVPVAVYQSGRLWLSCVAASAFAEADAVPPLTRAWMAAIAALVTLALEPAEETDGMTALVFEALAPLSGIGANSFEIVAAFMPMRLSEEMSISASP
jgi:hypothetical protein